MYGIFWQPVFYTITRDSRTQFKSQNIGYNHHLDFDKFSPSVEQNSH